MEGDFEQFHRDRAGQHPALGLLPDGGREGDRRIRNTTLADLRYFWAYLQAIGLEEAATTSALGTIYDRGLELRAQRRLGDSPPGGQP